MKTPSVASILACLAAFMAVARALPNPAPGEGFYLHFPLQTIIDVGGSCQASL
jgi:hypothetical protein